MPCPDDGVLMSVEAISVEGGNLLARAAVPPHPRARTSWDTSAPGLSSRSAVVSMGARLERGSWLPDLAGSHAGKRAVPAAMTWPIPEGLESLALLAEGARV
jgi:NADPH:quinone reductase